MNIFKSSNKVALLFPGQGSQKVGMGKDIFLKHKCAKDIFERMDSVLNIKLSEIMFNGDNDTLSLSKYSQPAILACSYAMFKVFQEKTGFQFDQNKFITVGHSLGEFSALAVTKMFEFEDAIEIVHKRGKAMQECLVDGKETSMVAIMGDVKVETLKDLIYSSDFNNNRDNVVEIANINSPQQIVLSGYKDSVYELIDKLKNEKKLKFKSIPLNVKLPFHTNLLNPVCDELKKLMDDLDHRWRILNPSLPILMNLDCKIYYDSHLILDNLVNQTILPVDFAGCMRECEKMGITEFIEVGFGSTLSSLASRNLKNVNTANILEIE